MTPFFQQGQDRRIYLIHPIPLSTSQYVSQASPFNPPTPRSIQIRTSRVSYIRKRQTLRHISFNIPDMLTYREAIGNG